MLNIKYKLIFELLKSLSVEEIVELKKSSITPQGLTVGKKVIPIEGDLFKYLKEYIIKNKHKINEYLFPAKNGQKQTPQNLILGIRFAARKIGKTLSDLGLAYHVPKKQPPQINTLQDLVAFLNTKPD